ncbi:MAG: cytochrome c oxidase assembly protein [Hydrogenibacillus sp.]|nr:cytochrome c oxidase assembly protein [Hydrogenibacillus sp.]
MREWEFVAGSGSWNRPLLGLTVGLMAAYVLAVGPMRPAIAGAVRVPFIRQISFLAGLGLLVVCWGSPLLFLSHVRFSAHMVQMSLCYFIVPPLLLIGLPDWAVRPLAGRRAGPSRFRRLFGPRAALWSFNGLFVVYHIPPVFDRVMTHAAVHHLFLTALFVASVGMWWPLVGPIPEQRLPEADRKRYISANERLLLPACLFLLLVPVAVFQTYNDPVYRLKALGVCFPPSVIMEAGSLAAVGFPYGSSLQDQQLGSLIMLVLHAVSYAMMMKFDRYVAGKSAHG